MGRVYSIIGWLTSDLCLFKIYLLKMAGTTALKLTPEYFAARKKYPFNNCRLQFLCTNNHNVIGIDGKTNCLHEA